jgi:hypothetical protein
VHVWHWTGVASAVTKQGSADLVYDPDHHIVYATNETQGLWRMLVH